MQLEGVKLQCLLDSGSEVTTVTERFSMTFMQPKGKKLMNIDVWLRLRAANGLDIPYLGYELDMEICGEVIPRVGALIVKDSTDSEFQQRKQVTPGIIGNECHKKMQGSTPPSHG